MLWNKKQRWVCNVLRVFLVPLFLCPFVVSLFVHFYPVDGLRTHTYYLCAQSGRWMSYLMRTRDWCLSFTYLHIHDTPNEDDNVDDEDGADTRVHEPRGL